MTTLQGPRMEQFKHTMDAGAATVWIASMAEILPPIAAALSILWLLIQIGDFIWRKLRKRKKGE